MGKKVLFMLYATGLIMALIPFKATPSLGGVRLPSPQTCRQCHPREYREWRESYHAKALSTPTFRAMFTIHNLEEPDRPDKCLYCHAPEAKLLGNEEELKKRVLEGKVKDGEHGITCVICHSITDAPETGDSTVPVRLEVPSLPPYHKVRRDRLTTSERLCSSCHNYNSGHRGDVPCCTINREWRVTSFARKGISCQSCHMRDRMGVKVPSLWGRIKRSLFALTYLDRYMDDRDRVSHRFPGPRDPDFLRKGVEMVLKLSRDGDKVTARVEVLNRAGHRIPNGCPPRTRIVLKVLAQDERGNPVFTALKEYGFDFRNANGFIPGTPWGAVERVNENFLEPEGKRVEVFEFRVPGGSREIRVRATLTYVYIQPPPPEARLRMQQMMGRRVLSAPPEERERVAEEVQREVAIRMKAMRILTSTFPDLKMAEVSGVLRLE